MKKIIFALSLFALFSCNNSPEKDTDLVSNTASANGNTNENLPEITFEEDEYDFGKITQGEKVSHAFKFKNTGKKALIIASANGSCGCTVPEFPKEPIQPGEEGKISVLFNSEGKKGYQEKTVTIVTNCEPATRVIRIKTEIIVAEAAYEAAY